MNEAVHALRLRGLRSFMIGAAPALVSLLWQSSAIAQPFSYNPPGQLVPNSGEGRFDEKDYAPGMRFPIESAPAYANSQVWGTGGSQGPSGSQCAEANFSYPWSDNYCETRSWDMPLCPSGTGHQGQDIRAATCDKNVYPVVASESGTVTNVGSYSVYITAADGTRYDYLHMGSVAVSPGQDVQKGTVIGRVSNEFGGTPTSVHLHFNLRQNVDGLGSIYVPPYMSLVNSYQALVGPVAPPPTGALSGASCESLLGFVSPSEGSAPIDVRLYFDGAPTDGNTVGHTFLADLPVDTGCNEGCACDGTTCAFGFDIPPPFSLFDGSAHSVLAYGSDGSPELTELTGNPLEFNCAFEVPSGVRRKVTSDEVQIAWRFSSFWDELEVSDGIIAELAEGEELPSEPKLVASSDAPDALFVVDGSRKRRVDGAVASKAWGFEFPPELLSASELEAMDEGPAWPRRPMILVSAQGERFLVDAKPETPPTSGNGGGDASSSGGDGGSGGGGGDSSGGCSCSTPGTSSSHALLAVLGLLPLLRRRKRD